MPPDPIRPPPPWTTASLDELQALHRLSSTALNDLSPLEVADLALDEVMATIAPDRAFLYVAIDNSLVLQGVRPRNLALSQKQETGKCLCDLAAKNRQPLYSRDIHDDERYALNGCKEDDIRSFAALPLTVDDETIGVLGLVSTRGREFPPERSFLEAMAATIALIIKKARTGHQLRERALDLEGRIADCTAELAIRANELERLNRIFVDREIRIKKLRERVKTLEGDDDVRYR